MHTFKKKPIKHILTGVSYQCAACSLRELINGEVNASLVERFFCVVIRQQIIVLPMLGTQASIVFNNNDVSVLIVHPKRTAFFSVELKK